MTQLTKEYFDKQLKKLASTDALDERIDPLTKILRQTTALMTHMVEDVRELKTDMRVVKKTLDDHTTTLDAIFKNTETSKAEQAAFKATIERHERWFAQLADRVGIKLQGLEQ